MFGPRKKILWSSSPLPLSQNAYPLRTFKNFSLGREAKSLAIYVPLFLSQKSVQEVEKLKSNVPKGGKDLSLVRANELEGRGVIEDAFEHPIKVYN